MPTTVSLGGMATFNMQHGFVEALVRGFRSGFLSDETYHHLTQCETLEVRCPFFPLPSAPFEHLSLILAFSLCGCTLCGLSVYLPLAIIFATVDCFLIPSLPSLFFPHPLPFGRDLVLQPGN